MVTSSAVVGSSAIIRSGRFNIAIAMDTVTASPLKTDVDRPACALQVTKCRQGRACHAIAGVPLPTNTAVMSEDRFNHLRFYAQHWI